MWCTVISPLTRSGICVASPRFTHGFSVNEPIRAGPAYFMRLQIRPLVCILHNPLRDDTDGVTRWYLWVLATDSVCPRIEIDLLGQVRAAQCASPSRKRSEHPYLLHEINIHSETSGLPAVHATGRRKRDAYVYMYCARLPTTQR